MKKKKKEHHEEHADETWLLPYSDMLTLLLALFIVMFAMGKTDQAKLQKMSQSFQTIFSGGSGIANQSGGIIVPTENAGSSSKMSNAEIETDKMENVKKQLEKEIQDSGYSDKAKVILDKEGLQIAIQDVVIFNSGDANVLQGSEPMLNQIATSLMNLNNNIRITGHTDNIPINNAKFRSNWDLSSMRAVNVMNFMLSAGMNPNKMSIQAYGQYQPKYDNSTQEGRAKNRRVEIFVIRNFPEPIKENKKE